MNVLHMKYAVEVAKYGSLNRASEALFVAQPNLSRSIKELEDSLGIKIFERSAKGMELTTHGEEFIAHAKEILQQIENVENMYKTGTENVQRFSISVPRCTYISEAFARFSNRIDSGSAEIFYRETNSSHAIRNVVNADYKLAIVRYAENYDKYFKSLFIEKGLENEVIAKYRFVLLMNENCPLSKLDKIHFEDIAGYTEIAHADPFVPSLSIPEIKKEELSAGIKRRIFVFERASQFDLLAENPGVFMWVSPIPQKTLERYHLVERECEDNLKMYKDVLVYENGYRMSKLDNEFVREVVHSWEDARLE